jgi:hypothetical protein
MGLLTETNAQYYAGQQSFIPTTTGAGQTFTWTLMLKEQFLQITV